MGGPVECFACGGDHYARDCPESGKGKGRSKKSGGKLVDGGKGSSNFSAGKGVECFKCGGPHFARDCNGESKGRGKRVAAKGKGGGISICFSFCETGICQLGDECRFSHDV
mmetsp:Transcript_42689/g.76533  ORF Transcript_42689/g.76533 Transcript_42689/m.76533 type:complete len:111 (-) Transcript_42689:52-384(-)